MPCRRDSRNRRTLQSLPGRFLGQVQARRPNVRRLPPPPEDEATRRTPQGSLLQSQHQTSATVSALGSPFRNSPVSYQPVGFSCYLPCCYPRVMFTTKIACDFPFRRVAPCLSRAGSFDNGRIREVPGVPSRVSIAVMLSPHADGDLVTRSREIVQANRHAPSGRDAVGHANLHLIHAR